MVAGINPVNKKTLNLTSGESWRNSNQRQNLQMDTGDLIRKG